MSEIKVKFSLADWAKPQAEMTKAFKQVIALRAKGVSWKEVTAETGVGYASGWLAEQRANLDPKQVIKVDPTNVPALCQAIRHARLAENNSWGLLMVRTGLPETQVRRAFELATNIQSEGLRNGKGGRFLEDNADAYAPAPKVGWVRRLEDGAPLPEEIRSGLIKAGVLAEDVAELSGMSAAALKAMHKELLPEVKVPAKKADVIASLAQALA